jgi:ParB/RepB/Spo0J family partition protein
VTTAENKGTLLEKLNGPAEVILQEIALDAIEPDPNQPRIHFDPVELEKLAASLKANGLLQEPAVYPVAVDERCQPVRFRLLFGERRWRAARLAGWEAIRCKVVPRGADEDLIGQLKRIDQREAENRDRAALSAVEEAKTIQQKLEVMQRIEPGVALSTLIDKLGAERSMSATSIRELLDLLDVPAVLRQAILERRITSRDIAFRLARYWKDLLRQHEGESQARRELKFRDDVRKWAQGKALEWGPEALTQYAAELHLDAKVVRSDVKKAERIEGKAGEEFERMLQRAIREAWTVKDARRVLTGRSGRKEASPAVLLFEQSEPNGKRSLGSTIPASRRTRPVKSLRASCGNCSRRWSVAPAPRGQTLRRRCRPGCVYWC